MRTSTVIGIFLAGALALVVAVVAVRTATYLPEIVADAREIVLAEPPALDITAAARHLGEAIRFRTVSHQHREQNDWPEWTGLRDWLVATYPAVHEVMSRELLAGYTLLYTWPGSDPARKPIVLLAHHDVVPVTPDTERDWRHPPFDGVLADDAVWGRGSVDDKGSLVAIFEALEALAATGFQPAASVIVVSGHDEEAGGSGAGAAAKSLETRGLRAEFVLDEGLAVVTDFPLLGRPVALVGIAEKGYGTLRVTARASGGHSSLPPPRTGVEVLAEAILAITSEPFPMRFTGPAADMVRVLAPEASLPVRMAVANEWLLAPLLVRQMAATPAGAAGLHTTIAPTMLRGSPKENVLPQEAAAWINYRVAPGNSSADVLERARHATRKLDVAVDWEHPPYEPSPVSSTATDAYRTLAALAADGGQWPVAPGLVMATTDSRWFAGIAEDVYRFQPVVASLEEFGAIHGTNEHLSLDNLARMVRFYARLIATAAR